MTPKDWYAAYLMQFGDEQLLEALSPPEYAFLTRMAKDLGLVDPSEAVGVIYDVRKVVKYGEKP